MVRIMSRRRVLNIGIVGDPDAVPDLPEFAAGVSAALRQPGALDGARRPAADS